MQGDSGALIGLQDMAKQSKIDAQDPQKGIADDA